jgi:hypothetical protein
MFDFSVFRVRAFSGSIIGSSAMNLSYDLSADLVDHGRHQLCHFQRATGS